MPDPRITPAGKGSWGSGNGGCLSCLALALSLPVVLALLVF